MSRVRRPAVAGFFYPAYEEELSRYIEELFTRMGPGLPKVSESGKRRILGVIAPHAGYMYSGWIASYAYYEIAVDGLPTKVLIIGPNHTGLGTAISVYPGGVWSTPLGEVEIDSNLVDQITSFNDLISKDESAHIQEHSVEVHIPFLQYMFRKANKEFKIIPIVMMLQSIDSIKALGNAILNLIQNGIVSLNELLIVSSTDFTHYESSKVAKMKDEYAIKSILNLDPEMLLENIYLHDISMCGYGPVAVLLYIARKLGEYKVKLLRYGNSGDITGNYNNVVSYASFIIYR